MKAKGHTVYWPKDKVWKTCKKAAWEKQEAYGMFPGKLLGPPNDKWGYWFGGPLKALLEHKMPVTRVMLPNKQVVRTNPASWQEPLCSECSIA